MTDIKQGCWVRITRHSFEVLIEHSKTYGDRGSAEPRRSNVVNVKTTIGSFCSLISGIGCCSYSAAKKQNFRNSFHSQNFQLLLKKIIVENNPNLIFELSSQNYAKCTVTFVDMTG